MGIEVKKLKPEEIESLGIAAWPIWEKEASSFDWYYDSREDCYFLEGEVEVETAAGQKTLIQKGDFASFPQGLSCKWHIKKKVRKHYNFG